MAVLKSAVSKGFAARRDESAGSEDDEGRTVSALARGLFVLRAFEDASQTLANSELAQRTGLPKATITRLTRTLVALGYLESHSGGERFRLGPAVLTLGATFLRGNSFPRIVTPYLQRLANQTGCHVALGVREGVDCVYVQLWRGAGQTIILSSGVGMRLPLARSAMGMALLAAMPEAERRAVFAAMQAGAGSGGAALRRWRARCAREIAAAGFCVGVGPWRKEINAVAAPLPAFDGSIYAVNISGPAFLLGEARLREETGPLLAAAIEELRRLGIVAPKAPPGAEG
jgi:DNA-binding IclR family transcriptional regulator